MNNRVTLLLLTIGFNELSAIYNNW